MTSWTSTTLDKPTEGATTKDSSVELARLANSFLSRLRASKSTASSRTSNLTAEVFPLAPTEPTPLSPREPVERLEAKEGDRESDKAVLALFDLECDKLDAHAKEEALEMMDDREETTSGELLVEKDDWRLRDRDLARSDALGRTR